MTKAGSDSLPEYQSLRNSRDFRRVLDEGSRSRQGGLVVVRRPGPDGPPRVGLIVSRGSGGAVVRNRIKRRLRHLVVGAQLKPGNDYVIIANRQAYEVPHPELRAWLLNAVGAER